jgi:hypothetical protein
MILSGLFYLVLAWYFDNVIEANRGTGAGVCFFLKKEYWLKKKRIVY